MEPTVVEVAEARELVRAALLRLPTAAASLGYPPDSRDIDPLFVDGFLRSVYHSRFRNRAPKKRRPARWEAWKREVKLQLAGEIPPKILPRVEVFPDRVHCDWCADQRCLMCAKARNLWSGKWAVWMAAIREHGRPAQLAFADWLEEQGYDEATVVEWRTKEV